MTNRVQELERVIGRMETGVDVDQARRDAEDLIRAMTPLEFSQAERELAREAPVPHHLCEVHLRVLAEEGGGEFRATLTPGHPLDTLMAEHEIILQTLDALAALNQAVQQAAALDPAHVARLEHIATHLVDAEPHHAREEDALFPELEKRYVSGPPQVMRLEHVELRQRKHALLELARAAKTMPYAGFRRRLNELAGYLVPTLRDHIAKEDHILYPMAAQVITDPALWADIQARCDEIGYCCFTPAAAR